MVRSVSIYRLRLLFLSFVIIIFDQWSKAAMVNLTTSIDVAPFLSLFVVYNTGIAFGWLANSQMTLFLGVCSFIISIFLCHFLLCKKSLMKLQQWAVSLILAGAIANGIDRVARGHVVDFIYFHYQEYYFPVFNVADCVITTGMALWIMLEVRCYFYDKTS